MLIDAPSGGKQAGTAGARVAQATRGAAASIETRAPLILAAFSILFCFRFIAFNLRRFWYDEFFTIAVARQSELKGMWDALTQGLDLTPPLGPFITHLSMRLFGENELSARFPSTLGFLAFVWFAYAFAARRTSKLTALSIAILLAATAPATIVGQARPYGLMLGFGGLAIFSWQSAASGIRRWLYLPLLSLGLTGALLCHCYAVMLLLPFVAAETLRYWISRKIDWATAAALLIAMPAILSYLPILAASKGFVPGAVVFMNWGAIPQTYEFTFNDGWGYFVIAAAIPMLARFIPAPSEEHAGPSASTFLVHERVFLMALALLPVFGVLTAFVLKTPWSERYALACSFGVCTLAVAAILDRPDPNRAVGLSLLAALGVSYLLQSQELKYQLQPELGIRELAKLPDSNIDRAKPFVISNGLLMKQADYYESADRLKNVYYLTDSLSSQKFTGFRVFGEHFRLFRQFGALNANLADYRNFISAHKTFYVYGPYQYSDDWLMQKLSEDGASVRVLRREYFPANPEMNKLVHDAFLFDVSMP